jgi:Ca2+-binding RTX toxin-like protein
MAFSMLTAVNGEYLKLTGDTDGGFRVSSRIGSGDATIRFESMDDLTINAQGDLDATIVGGVENDTFDFLLATGNYSFYAGAGNDLVIDGPGNNIIDGGAGADNFTFASGNGVDTINNYVQDDDDIDLIDAAFQDVEQTDADTVTVLFDDGNGITVNSINNVPLSVGAIEAELLAV